MKKAITILLCSIFSISLYAAPVRNIMGARSSIIAESEKMENPYWGLCFTAEEPNVVVNMTKTGSPPAVTLETSRDGVNWVPFDADGKTTPITLAKVGDYVYFRAGSGGNTRISSSSSAYRTFTTTKNCAASGNIMSLLDGENEENSSLVGYSYVFCKLFDQSKITTPPVLPAIQLGEGCYHSMFIRCYQMKYAPELPATTLGSYCYCSMFQDCRFTKAPDLPSTNIKPHCYENMFRFCSKLVEAPMELPGKSLDSYCYAYMFWQCSSLTNAPKFAATYLGYMGACNSMFYACSLIDKIEVKFTSWGMPEKLSYWLNGVSSTGTFYCPTSLGTNDTIERGPSRCPTGWTVVNID